MSNNPITTPSVATPAQAPTATLMVRAETSPSTASTTTTTTTPTTTETIQSAVITTVGASVTTAADGTVSTVQTPIAAPDSPPSGRIPSEVTAGIAVATAVTGVIIGALGVWLVMKVLRKKHSRSQRRPVGAFTRSLSNRSAPYRDTENGAEKLASATNPEYVMPQALDDNAVRDEVGKLFGLIEDHVDSQYYHDRCTKDRVSASDCTKTLPAAASVLKDHDVTFLLDDQRTRFATMKAAIAAELLAAISFHADTSRSLLPEMVTLFLDNPSARLKDNHRTRLSISRWRTSTAFLIGDRLSNKDLAHRDQAVEHLFRSLDVVLSPFENSDQAEARKENLIAVCKQAETLGLILLSQPAEWSFDWSYRTPRPERSSDGRPVRKATGRPLVYFPRLVRLTDNLAARLETPRTVLMPRVKD